ncbi:MAG: hypothetical protein IT379_24620 [Deltaproteobacteria bacterium]|nr:hypothetical protein [Deltaproteobacteria bacterium]
MAVVTGDVKISMSLQGQGDGAKKVREAKDELAGLQKQTALSHNTAENFSKSLKEQAKGVNFLREGFENLRSNLGFVSAAFGAVITVATTLWTLLGGSENPIPQFVIDTENAAKAEYELARQLMQTVEASKQAAVNIDAVRVSTLKLAAANAEAAGDQKRQADLLRQAGITEATNTAAGTQKSIDDLFARRQALNQAEQAAIAREKSLRAESVRAFGLANNPGDTDMAHRGRAHAAGVAAEVAANLAAFEAKKAREESDSLTKQIGAQNEALKAQRDAIAAAADTTIKLDETLIMPGESRGGGTADPDMEFDPFEGKWQFRGGSKSRNTTIGVGAFASLERNISGATGRTDGPASQIRDFSAALTEALPGMSEFNALLGQLSETWTLWGEGSKTTKDAVVGSLGAIAKAGAAQIRDERLRAGVLSVIELGLGFANLANPAIASGHFTASAILGGVALFGGSSGGARGGGSRAAGSGNGSRIPARLSGAEDMGGGRVSYVIHGNYYGGRAEQEAAADQHRLSRRLVGTGFERGRG